MHGTFFWAGLPDQLLYDIFPPMLFNMALASIVAADFVLTATADPDGRWRDGFLPNRLQYNLSNMESLTRMMLLAVSLMATWRLNRVYERWWAARQAFASIGTVAVSLAQRAHAWVAPTDADPAAAARRDAIARWATVWHYSIWQMCTFGEHLPADGAALLRPAELELYEKTRKPRQLVTLRLATLIKDANLPTAQALAMEELLARGTAAAGVVGALRFQCMPDGLVLLATGFVETFLLMLPLSWWSAAAAKHARAEAAADLGPATVSAVLTLLLYLGCNLLFLGALAASDKLEDPFPRLPLADIVDTTRRDVERVAAQVRGLAALDAGGGEAAKGGVV